jgi:hypothetical protein
VTGFNKNRISWDIPFSAAVDSFFIFRESNTTGIYQKIGSMSYNEPGVFVDSSSHPEIQSNKYRISLIDTCGFESDPSIPHKTIHLAINQGQDSTWNLIWEPYEGFDVSTYYIYRGTSTSNLVLIGSTSGSSTQFSDFTSPAGYVYYQIEVINPDPCGTMKSPLPTSRSNIATNNPLFGIESHSEWNLNFKVSPNPATNIISVDIPEYQPGNKPVLNILNVNGQVIKFVSVIERITCINISNLSAGAYLIRVTQENSIGVRRLIKY